MQILNMVRDRTRSLDSDSRRGTGREKRGDLGNYTCQTILDTSTFSNVFTGSIMRRELQ